MSCDPMVYGTKAEHIQIVEDFIRKTSEVRISQLELGVLKALSSGLKLTDLKIIEIIEWTDNALEFKYSVEIKEKKK